MRALASALTLMVSALLVVPATAQDATVSFELREKHSGGTPLPEFLSLVLTNSSTASPSKVQVVVSEGRGRAVLPKDTQWNLRLVSDSWVIPLTQISAAEDRTVSIDVLPAAILQAVVVTPEPSSAHRVSIDIVNLEGQPAPLPHGTRFSCESAERGATTCVIPSVARNVVMRVAEMAPRYFWDLKLTAGESLDLGRIAFRPGSSFSAYLERDVVEQLSIPARAVLIPPLPPVSDKEAARLAVTVAEGTFDKRGFLQLSDVPAGTYNLKVTAKGFAPRIIGPLDVHEGKETSFRKAIELFPPVEVTVSISPPVDLANRRWTVHWHQIGEFAPTDVGIRTQADEDGRVTLTEQPPGTFSLKVLNHGGDSIWSEDVRVGETGVVFPVELNLRSLRGTVKFGSEPLSAVLWFGTTNGPISVRTESNAEGEFQVQVPERPAWPVEIINDVIPVRSVIDVNVDESSEIDIEVPDTSVSGWVLGVDGQRLTKGTILGRVGGRTLSASLTDTGEFMLRGLPEGVVNLFASTPNGRSAPVAVRVMKDRPLREVELRMLRTTSLAGVVQSAGRTVIGGHVSVFPLVPRTGRVVEAATDRNGEFEVEVAEQAERVLVVIGAPGRTLQSFDVAPTGERLSFDIAQHGGTIVVRFRANPNLPFTLFRHGVEIPALSIFGWIAAHGTPTDDGTKLTISDLAPGHYRVCGVKCAEGFLAPGATLELAAD